MRRSWLIGIAAISLAAGPALAQGKGGGHGNGGEHGNGGGNGHAVQSAMQPGGGGNGNGNGNGKGRGNGGGDAMRGSMQSAMQAADHGPGHGNADKADRGKGNGSAHADARPAVKENRGQSQRAGGVQAERGKPDRPNRDNAPIKVARDNDRGPSGGDLRQVFAQAPRGLIDGCPPGLAAKNNGCRPPGLAKQEDATWRDTVYRPDWWGLDRLSNGSRYLYDNGYLYQLGSGGNIAGFVPLLGGALSGGNQWPSYYAPVTLPDYYRNFYGLGSPDSYRLADNVIYGVDPTTQAISSIAALLTGDTFNVGQQLPLGYDVYNVPYAYRDQYADSAGALYRYNDGCIYQVDPKTQLITAAIQLLANKVL